MPQLARLLFVIALIAAPWFGAATASADNGYPFPGTQVLKTDKSFATLWKDLEKAIGDNKMGLVGQASASSGANRRGVKIPGNAIFGVYRNDFAVRMLQDSVPAGIEAPLRFYLTEAGNGGSVLTYRLPSAVFKPYGNTALDIMARELDKIFSAIAKQAVK